MLQKLFLIPFLLCFAFFLNGQDYQPFPEEDGVWHVASVITEGFPNVQHISRFEVMGDTIIGDFTYQKLYRTKRRRFRTVYFDTLYWGAYRNFERKLLYIQSGQETEATLYDFNLEIGDRLDLPLWNCEPEGDEDFFCNSYFRLSSIDSVELGDAIYRNRYNFEWVDMASDTAYEDNLPTYWIEGIGCNFGFFPTTTKDIQLGLYPTPASRSALWCFLSDSVEYKNPTFAVDDCFPPMIVNDVENLKDNTQFKVYPNPTSELLYIENQSGKPFSVKVFDSTGRLILENHTASDNPLDLSGFPKGIYLLLLTIDEAMFSTTIIRQ